MQPDVRIVLRFWKKSKRRNKNNTYKSPEDFSGRRPDYLPGIFILYRYGYSGYKLVIVRYCHLVMGMVFDLIPIVIAWGTIALVIATYTPVFNWISYLMGLYMKLFDVKEAFAAAPATLYTGRVYRYVYSRTASRKHQCGKDQIYRRCAFSGTDYLSDRGWNHYYQE